MGTIIGLTLASVWGICFGAYRTRRASNCHPVRSGGVWECHRHAVGYTEGKRKAEVTLFLRRK